ncbi:MAG: TAXI family TRAP transporter solute-binding subunit [Rhodoplanes sp.]
MAEGLQRLRWRRGCLLVLTAALVTAAFSFSVDRGHAQGRSRASLQTDRSETTRTRRAEAESTLSSERINANTVAIISGNINGTYLSIAYDLSAVLDEGDDFRILPIIGKGGGQNLRDVRFLKGVDLGITQSILLNKFRKTKELGPIDDKITYIAKLFNEEMHLVVRADSGITSIAQLDGKKVNFSDEGSGTQLSTRDVFERLGIKPVEVNMGQADAIEKLKTGELAATILIAGKPSGAMAKLKSADGFRLLPVPFAKPLQADYLPAALTNKDYPNLVGPGESVETIAVGAVLIAYNWPRDSDRYQRIAKFVERFFPRLAEFQRRPRHPKWAETNLAATVPGWTRFPAAEEWLQRNNATAHAASQRAQFERFLETRPQASSKPISPSDREQLFQEFLKWSGTRERR